MATFTLLQGLPGSGKGTQAKAIALALNAEHISCGELCRMHVSSRSPFGLEILPYIQRGEAAPDDLVCEMLLTHLSDSPRRSLSLLEGFPRSRRQAYVLDGFLEKQKHDVNRAILLDIPTEVALRRIVSRRLCSLCGADYNELTRQPITPGVCDYDTAVLIQRDDDRLQAAQSRVYASARSEREVSDFYRLRNLLTVVDANRPVDDVTHDILTKLAA